MENRYYHLKITKDIEDLNIDKLGDNLLYYSYHTKELFSLINKNDKESPQFISAYNRFRGELFENTIYELLLQYAINNKNITKFVLKGPHQSLSNKDNKKFGLLMDKNRQIVYKAGYKDISEYDAMFFTKDSVYYVESTVVQSTTGLRKRLRKKTALLQLLFPNLQVKALIILSKGATGINKFPPYATVWVTKSLNPMEILNKLAMKKGYKKGKFLKYNNSKLIEAHDIKVDIFKYFDTLGWILRKGVDKNSKKINESFFLSKKIQQYIDIYSKIYIGYILKNTLKLLLNGYSYENFSLKNIADDKYIYVSLDKGDDNSFDIIYYVKDMQKKLKKIEFINGGVKISDKDPKGFTAAETRYIQYNLKKYHELNLQEVLNITCRVKKWSI